MTVEKLASAEWLPERSAGFFPKLLALLVLAGVSASTVVFVLWGLVR